MNILLINHYAGSPNLGMEFRPYYLARQWKKMGHNVTIIGSSYSHLRTRQPDVRKDLETEEDSGISYVWIKAPCYKKSFKRIINILVFVLKLKFYAKKLSRQYMPEAVIASSTYPLDIYPAYAISKFSGSKLCFEVHDLWPLSPMVIGGYSKYHPFILIMQFAENFAYRHSDLVVSLLGNAREHMMDHGLAPGKFIHIPNGYDRDEFENMQEDVPAEHFRLVNSLREEKCSIVGYTGGHAPSNALDTMIEAASLLKERGDIKFVLVGNGPEKAKLQIKSKSLRNIYFLPPVPKKSMPKLLKLFDILFIGGVKSSLHKHGISPNKLIDYMLAAKPIILSADVENEIVEKVNCGITVPAEDSTAVSKAIEQLLLLSTGERNTMGERGRNYAVSELDYQKLALRFIKELT